MKFHKLASLLLSSALFAPAAFAGNVEILPVANDVAVAPPAVSWQGLYAGGQVAFAQGELASYSNGTYSNDLFTEGTLYGVFAGYNFQSGKIVYGGEVGYMFGETAEPNSIHTLTTEDTLDLKARVGYAAGNFLLYGFGGWSTVKMIESPTATPMQVSGLNYGVGVDMQVNNRFIVGVDYTIRDLSGDFDQNVFPGWTAEGPFSTIGIRAGIKF